jgi:hypothetical protein
MLMPRSYAWTSRQKSFILITVVALIGLSAVGIFYYEHHARTTDSVLIGTWAFPPLDGGNMYFRLNPDHTFRVFTDDLAENDSDIRGLWFGGGDFVYFRRPTLDTLGFATDHPLWIWRLESITPDELHVRLNPDGVPRTVRRVRAESP